MILYLVLIGIFLEIIADSKSSTALPHGLKNSNKIEQYEQ